MTSVGRRTGGLGRGLGALIPQRIPADAPTEVSLRLIARSPLQPRRRFAEESLAELASSIRQHGVLQPVVLAQTAEGYRVVAGERRVRAAELAGTPEVFEATVNRDAVRRFTQEAGDAGGEGPNVDVEELGVPEAELTTAVDVTAWTAVKRRSMQAHASQIAESSFFLALPEEAFARAFGTEWFIHRGRQRRGGDFETSIIGPP